MPISQVNAETVKQWLDNGEAVLIDVREPGEHAAQHIDGAMLHPLGKVCCDELPDTAGKKVVLHCARGKRSAMACQKLLAEDDSLQLYNLEGGISAWGAQGLPVNSNGKRLLPLDRQVQLTIGVILVIASLMGYDGTPSGWFTLTGLVGIGLTIAGLVTMSRQAKTVGDG